MTSPEMRGFFCGGFGLSSVDIAVCSGSSSSLLTEKIYVRLVHKKMFLAKIYRKTVVSNVVESQSKVEGQCPRDAPSCVTA